MPVGGIAGCGLFVSGGYGSEFLDLCLEVSDEVPPLAGMFVMVARNLSVCLGRRGALAGHARLRHKQSGNAQDVPVPLAGLHL